MRGIGWLLLGVGAVWMLYALSLDTSVELPYGFGGGRVQNLSLMEHRRTHLMLAGGVLIAAVLLLGFSHVQGRASDDDEDDEGFRQCPYCAELVRIEAVICKHCRSELPAIAADDAESDPDAEAQLDVDDEPSEPGQSYTYRALREAAEAAEARNERED